jgi:hypothetical protein
MEGGKNGKQNVHVVNALCPDRDNRSIETGGL